jgi:hypothetical protein
MVATHELRKENDPEPTVKIECPLLEFLFQASQCVPLQMTGEALIDVVQ